MAIQLIVENDGRHSVLEVVVGCSKKAMVYVERVNKLPSSSLSTFVSGCGKMAISRRD